MTKEQRLKKRYRAEKRFKMYGLISVSLAVIFVLILVQNIFSKGSSAFSRTMIEVAVNYDSSLLELEGPINQNSLKDAEFYDLAVESLLKIYPAKDSKEERFKKRFKGKKRFKVFRLISVNFAVFFFFNLV